MIPATDPRRRFGDRGEDLAAVFLLQKGFTIISRNWNCRLGEIDLIATRNGVTHFVEVKTRRTTEFGHPEEAITKKKLLHLSRAIEEYLRQHSVTDYQADAVAITITDGKPAFHFIEGIL